MGNLGTDKVAASSRSKRYLITGATGTLGQYLVAELLKDGHDLLCLAHNPLNPPKDIPFILGDVTRPGLSEEAIPDVDAVINAAGIISFRQRDKDLIWEVNYEGTMNVAKFCLDREIPLFHISTAYVCGNYKGTFLPDELACGQHLRNEYEKSKYEAEGMLRISTNTEGLKRTIIRPSILVGDSKVAGLPPLAGYYLAVKALDSVKRWAEQKLALPHMELTIRLQGSPDNTLNMIPVDIAARQIADIIKANIRGTFHVVNTKPPTLGEVTAAVSRVVHAEVKMVPDFTPNPAERLVGRMMGDLFPYLRGEPIFEASNTQRISTGRAEGMEQDFLMETALRFLEQK